MDAVTVKAVMTKAEDVCVPLGVESVVSMAAQFFAPDYAPKMNKEDTIRAEDKATSFSWSVSSHISSLHLSENCIQLR